MSVMNIIILAVFDLPDVCTVIYIHAATGRIGEVDRSAVQTHSPAGQGFHSLLYAIQQPCWVSQSVLHVYIYI